MCVEFDVTNESIAPANQICTEKREIKNSYILCVILWIWLLSAENIVIFAVNNVSVFFFRLLLKSWIASDLAAKIWLVFYRRIADSMQ